MGSKTSTLNFFWVEYPFQLQEKLKGLFCRSLSCLSCQKFPDKRICHSSVSKPLVLHLFNMTDILNRPQCRKCIGSVFILQEVAAREKKVYEIAAQFG